MVSLNPKAWFSSASAGAGAATDSDSLSDGHGTAAKKGDGPVSESTSLLQHDLSQTDSLAPIEHGNGDTEDLYQTSDSRRQIGVVSAVFLIFNRMIGTGIFATPSAILSLSGSVGLALMMWVAGMLVAAAGMAVYLEFGTGMPRNGGEKNYLELVYRKPKFLATGLYTGYVVLLGGYLCFTI